MKTLTPEQQTDYDRVKKMIWDNCQEIIKWTDLTPEEKKKLPIDYIKKLMSRTKMLVKSIKTLDDMLEKDNG